MREILFRGKSMITNEWVYGGIVHKTDFYGDIVDRYYIVDGTDTRDYDIGYAKRVIPETVGQYTGVTDKNGTKIFEGDIIQDDEKYRQEDEKYIVAYDESYAMFSLMDIDVSVFCAHFHSCDEATVKIIGNIYDNPELIPKEKKMKIYIQPADISFYDEEENER